MQILKEFSKRCSLKYYLLCTMKLLTFDLYQLTQLINIFLNQTIFRLHFFCGESGNSPASAEKYKPLILAGESQLSPQKKCSQSHFPSTVSPSLGDAQQIVSRSSSGRRVSSVKRCTHRGYNIALAQGRHMVTML